MRMLRTTWTSEVHVHLLSCSVPPLHLVQLPELIEAGCGVRVVGALARDLECGDQPVGWWLVVGVGTAGWMVRAMDCERAMEVEQNDESNGLRESNGSGAERRVKKAYGLRCTHIDSALSCSRVSMALSARCNRHPAVSMWSMGIRLSACTNAFSACSCRPCDL